MNEMYEKEGEERQALLRESVNVDIKDRLSVESSVCLDSPECADIVNLEPRTLRQRYRRTSGLVSYRRTSGLASFLPVPRRPSGSDVWRIITIPLFFLLPSFIQSYIRPSPSVKPLYPTAWLDGLRGTASFGVFCCHLGFGVFDIYHGYHAFNDDRYDQVIRLPIFRLLFTGTAMVALFYVISGYVLSQKPLKLMRKGRTSYADLQTSLSSSIFRRGLRLYLPCVASSLFIAILIFLGAYEPYRKMIKGGILRNRLPHPQKHHISAQLCDWAYNFFHFISPFTWGRDHSIAGFDPHLWTIPVEFRASLFLFLTLSGVAHLRPSMRIATVLCLVIFICLLKSRWELLLFYGGMLFAEFDLIRAARDTSVELPLTTTKPRSRLHKIIWFAIISVTFISGLYFCSEPQRDSSATPGWIWLSSLIPSVYVSRHRFWTSIGALQIVWSLSHSAKLRRLVDNRFALYLGKISFALYLVHGFMINIMAYPLMWHLWTKGMSKETGFLVACVPVIPCTIWVADIFWRAFDIPSVMFATWLEEKLAIKQD